MSSLYPNTHIDAYSVLHSGELTTGNASNSDTRHQRPALFTIDDYRMYDNLNPKHRGIKNLLNAC